MRKTKDNAEVTRQKILDAAMVVFGRDGYSNARLEDIASQAGVTRGAVYHHFGGKPQVYTTLLDERFREVNVLLDRILSKGGTPLETLRRLMTQLFIYLEENEDYRAVQELVLFKTAYVPELEEGMRYKKESTAGMVGFIEDLIRKGIECGELKEDLDPRAAAIAAIGLFSGVSTLWILDSDMFSMKEYAEKMVDVFISGMANV